jgi:hypothetical protein
LSANPAFAATGVVRLTAKSGFGQNDNGGESNFGSGTLIHPNWILTAGHVVDFITFNPNVPGFFDITSTNSNITFGLGGDGNNPVQTAAVDQVFIHPLWAGPLVQTNDIALLHLSTPITNITPAKIFTPSLGSELGLEITSVGYGRSGSGSTGAEVNDTQRRAFTNIIDGINGFPQLPGYALLVESPTIFATDFDNPVTLNPPQRNTGSTIPTEFEGAIGTGDSGGGAYVNVGGENYVAGVNVLIAYEGNSTYGGQSGYTRVSQYESFINQYVPVP